MTMWCDRLVDRRANSHKQVQSEDVDPDREVTQATPPKRKQADREDKVQEMVDNLKEIPSSRYTTIQLCIWAEMIVSTSPVCSNISMYLRTILSDMLSCCEISVALR